MAKQPEDYFDRSIVTTYSFEDVPLMQEVWLMDDQWLREFAPAIETNSADVFEIGYHTKAIVHAIGSDALELSIYLTNTRFHEIKAMLPRSQFVICVDRAGYDVRTRLFVKGSWLTDLHLRNHSVFAIFDAIGVKAALAKGAINQEKLYALRERLDQIADTSSSIALVSFADSLIVKSNYQLGQYDSPISYSYEPETIIQLFPMIQSAFQDVLGLGVYAVVTQGVNEYSNGSLLSISRDHNHISLNSLGLPFAQLLAIDSAAREAIRAKRHDRADLYLDRSFFHSLAFDIKFDKSARPKYPYVSPMDSADNYYFAESFATVRDALNSS